MFKYLLCFLLSVFVLSSCYVSFPKETLEQDVEKFIKDETNTDTRAYKCGSTLYLDVCLEDLVTDDKQKIIEVYDVLQKIISNVVRVPLSSDADIKFVVVSAFDPNYRTLLRLFENVDDVKKYSYHFISREDYSERQLMEFEGIDRTKEILNNKYDLTEEEFVARLIVSQLNSLARTNPFLSKLIQVLELRFSHIADNKFYFISSGKNNNKEIEKIVKIILEKEFVKNIQKYKLFSIKSAILLDEEKNTIIDIPLSV